MATKNQVQEFISKLAPYAQAIEKEFGIPASLTLAQAGLETGWKMDAPGNNLFGVKYTPNWKGGYHEVMTTEEVNGKKIRIMAKFRSYKNIGESFADRMSVLSLPRYDKVRSTKDPFTGAEALQAAGYATDSSYADKLKSIIRSNNLTAYDQGGKLPSDSKLPSVELPSSGSNGGGSPNMPTVEQANWFDDKIGNSLKEWGINFLVGSKVVLMYIAAGVLGFVGVWMIVKGKEVE